MSTRICAVADDVLFDFAEGLAVDPVIAWEVEAAVDEHVAECDECQAFLAEVWQGTLHHDLSEPVVRILEMERLLIDIARLGSGILAEFARALLRYGPGGSEEG